jgi:hypothetical protein
MQVRIAIHISAGPATGLYKAHLCDIAGATGLVHAPYPLPDCPQKKILPILRRQKGFRDLITLVAPGNAEAVGISLWDSREQADA